MMKSIVITPGLRQGRVEVPESKSYVHRLLIADFLAGGTRFAQPSAGESEDICATRRCLAQLATPQAVHALDCGESGSTLRFLLPVAMLRGVPCHFTGQGRLAERPILPFLQLLTAHGIRVENNQERLPLTLEGRLQPGLFSVPGHISSQIVTGLLFALPCLSSDSVITCTTPLQSRGYVDMTLQMLRLFGISVQEEATTFFIPGNQSYKTPKQVVPEKDWSSAAFWIAMNSWGGNIQVEGLDETSAQPDRAILTLLKQLGQAIDISQFPDCFPILAVAAAAYGGVTHITGVKRLRMKESDRLAAMKKVLQHFGRKMVIEEDWCDILGSDQPFQGNCMIETFNDHRIAMAASIGATRANAPVTILEPDCVAKSYPDFFEQFFALSIMK